MLRQSRKLHARRAAATSSRKECPDLRQRLVGLHPSPPRFRRAPQAAPEDSVASVGRELTNDVVINQVKGQGGILL